MPTYLVEVHVPGSRADAARAAGGRARTAAQELSRAGTPIQYLRTTFLPTDETCFHLFEASSGAAVEEVSRVAQLGGGRIVLAVEAS
ncbi:MAG: DUF4242 domain-containing protein [Actinomycetes bacterium]